MCVQQLIAWLAKENGGGIDTVISSQIVMGDCSAGLI